MLLLIVFLLSLASFAQAAKLPKHWKICRKNDPNVNECLRAAIEFAIRDLSEGNPSLGVLPLDPLRISKLVIDQGQGPVSIKMTFKDLDVLGHKNAKVFNVTNDWKDMYIEGFLPQFSLIGKYKIEGRVLSLPITGEGDCNIVADNFTVSSHITLNKYKKNGKDHYEVKTFELEGKPSLLRLHFDNLFNGDKTLGDTMNRFLNENWREIVNEINPSLSKSFAIAHSAVTNRILSKVPIEDLLLK